MASDDAVQIPAHPEAAYTATIHSDDDSDDPEEYPSDYFKFGHIHPPSGLGGGKLLRPDPRPSSGSGGVLLQHLARPRDGVIS